jgi:hypothetical protein
MRIPWPRLLGYALCVVAGLMIAVDVLPKVVVLLLLAIGVVLLAASTRPQARQRR